MKSDASKGVFVPLATAFNRDGRVNSAAMEKLTQFVVGHGVHGVITAGSTGEFFGLEMRDRELLLETVLEVVNKKIPVYAGTGAITTHEAIKLTRQAETLGADGVLVITPFYISPSQEDLAEHYIQIAKSTRLPVIIYSNPARTGGVMPSPDTLSKLARVDNIIALKDSSGNLALTAEYITRTREEDFMLIMGQDKLFFSGLMHGCRGLIAATANVVPDLVVKLYEAYVQKDINQCLALQERVALIRQGFETAPFPVAAKEMIKMVGIDVGTPKAPIGSGKTLPSDDLDKLRKLIGEATQKF
jgi:4-hydroxy-tetrahydrodipicolinate synthase